MTKYFLIAFVISPLTCGLFMCVVKFQLFGDCPDYPSDLILLWSENILCMISVLLNLLTFVLWPTVFWQMFCVHLKRLYILLLLCGMFYKYQLGQVGYNVVEVFYIFTASLTFLSKKFF